MKRVLTIAKVMLILAVCISLVACSGKGSPSEETTAKQQTTTAKGTEKTTTTAKTEETTVQAGYVRKDYSNEPPLKVTLTGIAWGNGAEEDGLVEREFEKMLNLDMQISWIPYTDYTERLNMMMVSGNITDVVQIMPVDGKYFYPQVIEAIENGLFRDLAPYMLESGFKEANEIMKNWPDFIWENCKYDGKMYLLPRGLGEMASQSAVYYRKDIFDKTDLKEPTNVDELADFIIKMGEAAGDNMYGLAFSSNDVDSAMKMIAVAFTGVENWHVDDEGNFIFQSFMPEYKDFLLWVKRLYDAGAIDPEFVLNQPQNSSFEDGKSAVRFKNWRDWNQSEDLVTTKWFAQSVEPTAQVWAIGPLAGPKAPTVSVGNGAGISQAVMISSKFPEKDLDRLLWAICRDDADYLWFLHYGLEDIHYTMVDGQPSAITEEQKAAKRQGYVGGWNQVFLDQDPDYINSKFVRAHSSAAAIEQAKKMHEEANKAIEDYGIKNVVLTLNSDAYNSKWNALTKDLIDNRAKVVMGQMTIEEWDDYVNRIVNSNDYKQIIAEYKDAYLNSMK